MRIPCVIDKQKHSLADVLNEVLAAHAGHSPDVATVYFTVTGDGILHERLGEVGSLRLLLGAEPMKGKQIERGPTRRGWNTSYGW